ncbi:unnamed protein product [Caenorhabditis auriculariae]|uniref:Uncharacterized protein n=1 Tax=Caenorhabditis auriculariae TaxID=2777116 RepID=A0A8S1GPL5_9PELO|nr:unnamed protein product [Caenorhabditis auriculariae]
MITPSPKHYCQPHFPLKVYSEKDWLPRGRPEGPSSDQTRWHRPQREGKPSGVGSRGDWAGHERRLLAWDSLLLARSLAIALQPRSMKASTTNTQPAGHTRMPD